MDANMKVCWEILGYTEKDKDGLSETIYCWEDAPVEVLWFVESPWMANHWQVAKRFVCESCAADALKRSEQKKQKIIDNGGTFVRIENLRSGNRIYEIPIDVP